MLKTRIQNFLDEFQMPITVFCRHVNMSAANYYKWKSGISNFSEETEERISNYLSKYGF